MFQEKTKAATSPPPQICYLRPDTESISVAFSPVELSSTLPAKGMLWPSVQ